MWIGMGVFWIVLIGLVIFLVVRLLPGSSGSGSRSPVASGPRTVESAEQILDRMFATGEIDEQTYRARRGALSEMRKQS
jgi:putative membrane protein